MAALPDYAAHVRHMLFVAAPGHDYRPYAQYADGYPDWGNAAKAGRVNDFHSHDGWRLLQGQGAVEGILFGGCLDVLEMVRETTFWPHPDFWTGKILCLETSEEAPSVEVVSGILRSYGALGIWDRVSAVLIGRAARYSDADKLALDQALVAIIGGEYARPDLPIFSNMDFGHTDPQLVLPLGVRARLDCAAKSFQLIESWLR
jgi:muramoyltetrapeptide carboxypeptidase LdcA involved in peptidoglycan recycling